MDNEEIFLEANSAYEKGNFQRAFILFKKLADANNADAMSRIAVMYFDGEGVKRDFDKSIKWDKKALEAGSYVSYCNLAITYRCMGDILNAKTYFEKAIEIGDHDAALELAKLYMISELEKSKIRELLVLVIDSKAACDDSIQQAKSLLPQFILD